MYSYNIEEVVEKFIKLFVNNYKYHDNSVRVLIHTHIAICIGEVVRSWHNKRSLIVLKFRLKVAIYTNIAMSCSC